METGIVVWFNIKRGYGFVRKDSDGQDAFIHYSKIECEESFKVLEKGDRIEFDVALVEREGSKKLQAKNIRLLS